MTRTTNTEFHARRWTPSRHGKPAFALKGVVRARHLGAMASAYDASGIVGMAPVDAVAAARGNPVVVRSDLVRSIDSAKALGCSEVHVIDPLFRETALPYFGRGSLPLPVSVRVVVLSRIPSVPRVAIASTSP